MINLNKLLHVVTVLWTSLEISPLPDPLICFLVLCLLEPVLGEVEYK